MSHNERPAPLRMHLLEPLRGIAALWVFCFHYSFSGSFEAHFPTLHRILKAGDLGVPMFFVISGFCITASATNIIRRGESVVGFIHRRLRRIYPPFWCSIAVVASLPFVMEFLSSLKTGRFVAPSTDHLNHGYLAYDLGDWLRVATLGQVFASIPAATSLQEKFTTINAVYWTLAIEVQFYAAVALALVVRRGFYPALLLLTIASLVLSHFAALSNSGVFLPFWPQFAIGIVLYWLLENRHSPFRLAHPSRKIWCATLAAAAAIFGIAISLSDAPVSHTAFAVAFGALILLCSGFDRIAAYRLSAAGKRNPVIRYIVSIFMALGAMSFSLYLIHGKAQFLSKQIIRQLLPSDTVLYDVAAIVLTCGMSYVFFLCCERPFQNVRRPGRADTPFASGDTADSVHLPKRIAPTS